MIVKFFKTKDGGGVGSVNYLLNERVEQGTARVLKGDEILTKSIIQNMRQKQKTCVGCLSFAEQNIQENLKQELMAEFERALLTDEMQGRYNILWVEHTDKGRLELNFVIPKIDLETKTSMNPYYHKVDLSRIASWQDMVNIKHDFINPKDPEREQIIQGSRKEKNLFKNYEKVNEIITAEVVNGNLKSRDEIINFLKENGAEITRQGKDYIGVKLPDNTKAKRFKGGIYSEEFRSAESLRNISFKQETRERAFNQRDDTAEFERFKKQFERAYKSKSEYYQKRNAIRDRQNEIRTGKASAEIKEINNRGNDLYPNFIRDDFKHDSETNRSIDDSVRKRINERAREIRERKQIACGAVERARQEFIPRTRKKLEFRPREEFIIKTNRDEQQYFVVDEKTIKERKRREREAIERIREVRRERERTGVGDYKREIDETFSRLYETRKTIKDEYERNKLFAELYVGRENEFREHITKRIRDFREQFSGNVKEFKSKLREHGERSIKSAITKIKSYIKENFKELERTLHRNRGMER